ncbi:hypothetical protein [Neobacillus thermocopriae]|uniref:hypothetical protein n=2 Tax=Neobacillus thermocopriae TaxID=1215031 RepID=UPI00376F80E6
MNLKSGNMEQLKAFSQFESLKEFNAHFEKWLVNHKRDFTKGEWVGLKCLARFAAKVPGVANTKIETILKTIHEEYNENGISRSTFKRMTQKAIQLGVLTVLKTERENGSQSSNLYIFNRYPIDESSKEKLLNEIETMSLSVEHNQHDKDEGDSTDHDKNQFICIPNPKKKTRELHPTYVSDRVLSQPLKRKTIGYIRKMTTVCFKHKMEELERTLDIMIQCWKQRIRKVKLSSTDKNPISNFFDLASKKMRKLFLKE